MLGLTTIGNATLVAYDDKPVLVTDPWLGEEDHAYFGSWNLPHLIPSQLKQDILHADYVWISHCHPDHLNPLSIKKFKDKTILLADHVGQRVSKGLIKQGFKVQVLKDRTWVNISKNIKILCISDYLQDSVLLVDVNKKLFVNFNDSGGCGHFWFIKCMSSNECGQ
jgi:L-ascorbate metabolism protein UlaG (beta-lactamase superfamily)